MHYYNYKFTSRGGGLLFFEVAGGVRYLYFLLTSLNNTMNKLLSTPVISNLAYILTGMYLYTQGYPLAIALSSIFLGIASGIYHYHYSNFTLALDWIGMYAVFSYPTVAVFTGIGLVATLFWALITAMSILIHSIRPDKRYYILAAIIGGYILGMIHNLYLRELLHVLFIYSVAFTSWMVGRKITEIHEDGHFHALWHLTTAYGIIVITEYLQNC